MCWGGWGVLGDLANFARSGIGRHGGQVGAPYGDLVDWRAIHLCRAILLSSLRIGAADSSLISNSACFRILLLSSARCRIYILVSKFLYIKIC